MEVEICSDSADDTNFTCDEAGSGRRSQRIRKPSLGLSSDDYSTPPKRKKSDPKAPEQTIEEIYKQLGAVKAKSTSLETIYEQPKNFKDPSRNLMAGVKTRRSCVLAEFYNPSKFKLKTRKERAKRLKRLGVTVPTGDLISEAELQAALAVISEDEEDTPSNKMSHVVNTSLILVSPKRDVYFPSPEVSLVTGSSFIVPDQSFVEENVDVNKAMRPEELFKISLSFFDEPSEKVDCERSRSRKSRRSGGLRDFHSSTLSFRKEAAATAAKEPSNNFNSSLAFDPIELRPTFKERISAIIEKEEQEESPVADCVEESTSGTSSSSSCRRSPMNIGLPFSPKDYSLKRASNSSMSPKKDSLHSLPSHSAIDMSSSHATNIETQTRHNSASNSSPKVSKTIPTLFSSKSPRSKSPGTKDSCVSCKSSLKRAKLSPPTRSSRYSKALKRVSSPPPPCPVCTDCGLINTSPCKPKGGGAPKRAGRTGNVVTNKRKASPVTSAKSQRSGEKHTIATRGKRSTPKTGTSAQSFLVTSKQITGSVSSRKLNSTSREKSANKRRVSGVMKTLYASYLEHSSTEEEKSKSMNNESDVANSSVANVLEGACVRDDSKYNECELSNEDYIFESRNNFLEVECKSATANGGAAVSDVMVEEHQISPKNSRKRKFDGQMSLSPLTSQMRNLDVNDAVQETIGTASTTTSSQPVGLSRRGRRKTLDSTTVISLKTSLPKLNISPNMASKPTTSSPTCQISQLSLSSPVNQKNRSRTNHRRRSARLQAYTLMPLEAPSEDLCMEVEQALIADQRVPHVINKSMVHDASDRRGKTNGSEEALEENVVQLGDEEEDPGNSFEIADEDDDEEREISFKMQSSSGEPGTELMSGSQSPTNSSISAISLASVESTASYSTVLKMRTRRSALFTKDSFSAIEEKPIKVSKCSTTITQTKAMGTTQRPRQDQAMPKLSPRLSKKLDSSMHAASASSKPKRMTTLKTGTIAGTASSPRATRARVAWKTSTQSMIKNKSNSNSSVKTTQSMIKNKSNSNSSVKSSPVKNILAEKNTDGEEIIERPAMKTNGSNSSSIVRTLVIKSSSNETNVPDDQMETTSFSSDPTPSVITTKELNVCTDTLREKSSPLTKEENSTLIPSVLEQLDNNNEQFKDAEMKGNVSCSDTSDAPPPLPAGAHSDPVIATIISKATEEVIGGTPGSKLVSNSAPPSSASGASASVSPPNNPAVLVPAALPSPAETKKAFYLINKYKPRFSLSSHPSLGLNYNDGPTDDISSNSSDGKTKGSSADDKKNLQRRKSSSFASVGGGRACFAVHPALASCTTDVFAGRKMIFVPDKKGDGDEKSSAQAAFVSAVSKKLNSVNLKVESLSKGAVKKRSNSKAGKCPSSKVTKGVSSIGGPKGKKSCFTKVGKDNSPKSGKTLLAKTSKAPSPKMGKGAAAKKGQSPPSPSAATVASGSGSSNASPQLSRSPFGGKGKTKIMLNDLADQEAIFDSPSPAMERKDYIRTCLGSSPVGSLPTGSLLLKPGNAFSPPTLKPAQHIFPSTSPKSFSLPRSSTTTISSTITSSLAASKLATASLPPASKLPIPSLSRLKNVIISDLPTHQFSSKDSTVFPTSVSSSVTSQVSITKETISKVSAPAAQCATSFSNTNGHCPTAFARLAEQGRPLASPVSSASGIASRTDPVGGEHPSDLSKPASCAIAQPNPSNPQAVKDSSLLGCEDAARSSANNYTASALVEDVSSVASVPSPAPTSPLAALTFPVTPVQPRPSAPSSIAPPSSTVKTATHASGVLNLNIDSPLVSGMFNNAVGVRMGKVFANPKAIAPQKISETKKLLPTFAMYPH